jgi:hypothetical protein
MRRINTREAGAQARGHEREQPYEARELRAQHVAAVPSVLELGQDLVEASRGDAHLLVHRVEHDPEELLLELDLAVLAVLVPRDGDVVPPEQLM